MELELSLAQISGAADIGFNLKDSSNKLPQPFVIALAQSQIDIRALDFLFLGIKTLEYEHGRQF